MSKFMTRGDIRRALGRSVVCGFAGTSVTAELREILREVRPLGLVLFGRNIESPEQVAELNIELKSLTEVDHPLLLCVDQEGGRVARIGAPATNVPPMSRLGLLNDPATTEAVGAVLGQELRAMNFDLNFAPVLDVNTNPDNPVIGDRAFSNDPEIVAAHGIALIRGLHRAGVAGCGKHFPGHGDTNVDSHHDLPVIEHDPDRLRRIDWPPFAAAIGAQGAGRIRAIMSAHIMVPALDETWPGTLSPVILGHLRQTLGFSGVIFSDDTEMKALTDHHDLDTVAQQGSIAGIDVFLPCRSPESALGIYRGMVRAAERGLISHTTIQQRQRRVDSFSRRFYRPAASWQSNAVLVGAPQAAQLLRDIDHRLAQRGL